MQIANANPKSFGEQQQRIMTSLAGMQVAQGASNMAPSSGQAVIDQAMAQANGGSILQQQVALAAKQHFEANAKELKDTPGYSAAKRGWISAPPSPLNLSDPQALATGMQQRDQMAHAIATHKDLRETQWAKTLPIADLKDPEVREAVSDAVNAAYASLSARSNDMSGAFKKDRYDEAVKMVTGGVLSFRGSKIIAPWYGATDGNLSAAINSLTPADMAGAVTGDGTPFPATMLRPTLGGMFSSGRYRLETLGNGKYLVFSGDDTARRYVQKQGGGAFVLDLGAKKSGASAASMEFAGGPPAGALLSKQAIWSGGDRQAQDKTAPLPLDDGMVR